MFVRYPSRLGFLLGLVLIAFAIALWATCLAQIGTAPIGPGPDRLQAAPLVSGGPVRSES